MAELLRMGIFIRTLPMLVAQSRGYYAAEGLQVEYLQVASSTQQFEYLRDGRYDLIQTAPDNVFNYRLNRANPLGRIIRSQLLIGTDYGMNLRLVARPGINAVAELRGRVLAVDAPASGFAYVLFEILRRHGLELGRDYQIVPAGGALQRCEGLLAGQFDATLLVGGLEMRAASQGCTLLEGVYETLRPFMGTGIAALDSWWQKRPNTMVRLVRAYHAATQWVIDPANRQEAIGLLTSELRAGPALAEQVYEIHLREGVGIIPDLEIDPEAVYNTLALRADYGGFAEPQDLRSLADTDGGLYDLSCLRLARS